MRDKLFEVPKQSVLQGADESEPEPKVRAAVSKLTERHRPTETGSKVFVDSDPKKAESNTYTRN